MRQAETICGTHNKRN